MKKCFALFLALCLCFTTVACNTADDGSEHTLGSVAGWWTKPDGYEGITLIYTFCVDAESETVISYDDYGNVCDEYPCWYDENGLTIECGDVFGNVTFFFEDNALLDEEGTIQYVRCEPLSSDSAPVSTEELTGIWYKNGETDDGIESLIIEKDGYNTRRYGAVTGNGSWSLTKVEIIYDDLKYTGPAVEFEGKSGFLLETLWVLEDGNILYDAFHEEFYIKDGVDVDSWEQLLEKYELVRDDWEHEEDGSSVRFMFFGEVIFSNGSKTESIGKWEMTGDTLYLEYVDGSVQECEVFDEILINYCGKSFTRREAW